MFLGHLTFGHNGYLLRKYDGYLLRKIGKRNLGKFFLFIGKNIPQKFYV